VPAPPKDSPGYTIITSGDVDVMLQGQIAAGKISAPTPAAGVTSLYVVFTPPGAIDYNVQTNVAKNPGVAFSSTTSWAGYHLWEGSPGTQGVATFAYAVVPFPDAITKRAQNTGFGPNGLTNATVTGSIDAVVNQAAP
jgi:hypothetical protein